MTMYLGEDGRVHREGLPKAATRSFDHKLSQEQRDKAKAYAVGSHYCGIPIGELSDEDLLVMAMEGWAAYMQAMENASHERNFMSSLRRK